MDFGFTPEEEAFRQEVRAFLRQNPPESFGCEHGDLGYGFGGWSSQYLLRLGEKGWIGLTWPKDIGGHGLSPRYLYVLFQELAYDRAPAEAFFYSQAVGYSVYTFGSEKLKAEIVPGMLAGKISFAEALSEPNAGSDLLSLRTQAVEEEDAFVLEGQKTWISNGWIADYALLAARTDQAASRHKGISLLLVDLDAPGVVRRPIRDLAGEPSFSEIFLQGVRVPKRYLVGEKNGGLAQILDALEWDRLWARCVKAPYLRRELADLAQYCKETTRGVESLWSDRSIRGTLGDLAVAIEVCDVLFLRALDLLMREGGRSATHEVSIAKMFADDLGQRFFQRAMEILGLYGLLEPHSPWAPLHGRMTRGCLSAHGLQLAGGTPEIQRQTIAVRGLGMAKS